MHITTTSNCYPNTASKCWCIINSIAYHHYKFSLFLKLFYYCCLITWQHFCNYFINAYLSTYDFRSTDCLLLTYTLIPSVLFFNCAFNYFPYWTAHQCNTNNTTIFPIHIFFPTNIVLLTPKGGALAVQIHLIPIF